MYYVYNKPHIDCSEIFRNPFVGKLDWISSRYRDLVRGMFVSVGTSAIAGVTMRKMNDRLFYTTTTTMTIAALLLCSTFAIRFAATSATIADKRSDRGRIYN